MPDDLKALMTATSAQAKRDLCECYNTRLSTLKSLATDHASTVTGGLAMIAACVVNAAETGDNRILATFLDRLIGKPREIEPLGEEPTHDTSKDATIARLVGMIDDKKPT